MAAKYWRNGCHEFYRSLSKRAFVKALQRLIPELREADLVLAEDTRHTRGLLQRHGIDGDDGTTAIALVHAHAQAADAQDASDPLVLHERRLAGGLHQDVRAKPLYIEPGPHPRAEAGDRLRRDER